MIEQVPRNPNAETLAAMEEAKNWRNLPSYASVNELMRALKVDDEKDCRFASDWRLGRTGGGEA